MRRRTEGQSAQSAQPACRCAGGGGTHTLTCGASSCSKVFEDSKPDASGLSIKSSSSAAAAIIAAFCCWRSSGGIGISLWVSRTSRVVGPPAHVLRWLLGAAAGDRGLSFRHQAAHNASPSRRGGRHATQTTITLTALLLFTRDACTSDVH